MIRPTIALTCTLLMLSFANLAIAADAAKRDPAERPIYEALEETTEVEFKDAPISDVAEYLADFHRIPVVLDEKAFKRAGIEASSMPCTAKVKNLQLRHALHLILAGTNMSFMIRDHKLVITTPDAADAWQKMDAGFVK